MSVSILVPWRPDSGWRDKLWSWVSAHWQAYFPDAEILVADSGTPQFSRGSSINQAARQATGDLFVIADADTVFQPEAINAALQVAAQGGWVIPYAEGRYYNLNELATQQVLLNTLPGGTVLEPTPGNYIYQLTSWSGLLVMSRRAFETAGGFDERFIGWGYEDNAFQISMDKSCGHHCRIDSYCCHLWHPEGPRFGQPFIEHNRNLLYSSYFNT